MESVVVKDRIMHSGSNRRSLIEKSPKHPLNIEYTNLRAACYSKILKSTRIGPIAVESKAVFLPDCCGKFYCF
jgi:hypothetical protein